MVGRTLSHYRILEEIGRGGMGEVYLAEDTALDRKVALKVLPSEFAENEDRRVRFNREAKALAALNHPNIITIHSVEATEGVHFITMELVRGKTLAELLQRNGLPLNRFFEIAVPLADAVAAAHHVGISHRDLKPANVMVSDDGRVKVLDFGLAKLQQDVRDAAITALPTHTATQEGRIVGTLAYMSPEQAEGRPIDQRSDLFSLGVVFYEMLTGKRPFGGETASAVLASIIRETPQSARSLNPKVPRDLDKIVSRCLAKDVSQRIQTALDVRNQLEEAKADLASGEVDVAGARSQRGLNRWLVLATLALLLGIGVGVVYIAQSDADALPRFDNPTRLTTAAGAEASPTWSPDGGRVAFESNQSGNWDIWVTQVGGGAAVNLTADHRGDDRLPSWSPSGSEIAFHSTREDGGVFIMPALGGPARKILSTPVATVPNLGWSAPQWSKDGSELVAAFPGAETTLLVRLSFARQEVTTVTLQGRCTLGMSWSPDGRLLACAEGLPSYEVNRMWMTSVAGGDRIFLTTGGESLYASPSWSTDGRFLFFTSNRSGSMDLWRQEIGTDGRPLRDAERLTTALGALHARFSPQSDGLAYANDQTTANVWRVPILRDRTATWADAEPLTSEQARVAHLDVTTDGKRLVFSSNRSGSPDLWLLSTTGGEFKRLTSDPAEERGPQFSSDEKQIVFHSTRSGNRDIWVIPAEGGPARSLAAHPATDWFPTWSPDDTEIAFTTDRANLGHDVWVVPAAGGEPRPMTDHPSQDEWPAYSPDSQWIVFTSRRTGTDHLFRVARNGGGVESLSKGPGRIAAWAPGGGTLYFQGVAERQNSIWALSMSDRRESRVADLSGRAGNIGGSTLATDGRYLYFVWSEDQGDLWVMKVVKQ